VQAELPALLFNGMPSTYSNTLLQALDMPKVAYCQNQKGLAQVSENQPILPVRRVVVI